MKRGHQGWAPWGALSLRRGSRSVLLKGFLLALLTLATTPAHARNGDPLPGLTDAERAAFQDGIVAFKRSVARQEGKGPIFNRDRCYICHRLPVVGGQSTITETRFGRTLPDASFDPLTAHGGNLLQAKGFAPCIEVVPTEANVVIRRRSSSAMGAGLVEAIPDQQIIDRAAAEQAENASSAGRAHLVTSPSDGLEHVGRFGWKAQQALVVDFTADAMLNEMGVTNPIFPVENAPNGNVALLAQCDTVPDPEDDGTLLNRLTTMQRFLAPPARSGQINELAVQGEQLFNAIGCAFCHYNGYVSVSSNPALDGQGVPLYSDLLLHDIGTGDGIVQGDAQGNEFRTAPLWNVGSMSRSLLHDGRARSVVEAIEMHAGQALDARNAYLALSPAEQGAIQRFLRTLR